METVISKETHTKFRMKLEQTQQDYYVFLVPNHLVNESGMIDKKITDNILSNIQMNGSLQDNIVMIDSAFMIIDQEKISDLFSSF